VLVNSHCDCSDDTLETPSFSSSIPLESSGYLSAPSEPSSAISMPVTPSASASTSVTASARTPVPASVAVNTLFKVLHLRTSIGLVVVENDMVGDCVCAVLSDQQGI
jgi:hypothetical protein